MNVILDFVKSLGERAVGNKNSTIGGGVFGVVAAAVFGKLEEMLGCNIQQAFAGVDWGQLFVFGTSQLIGAVMTDANKTIIKPVAPATTTTEPKP